MIIGFILLAISLLRYLQGFLSHIDSAIQQNVQYMEYLIATIFLCSGLIIIIISTVTTKILTQNDKRNDLLKNILISLSKDTTDVDTCPNCGMSSKKEFSICEHCHGKK